MPHRVVRATIHDRRLSLGWLALAWIEYFVVHGRGDVAGMPIQHGDEMSGFIVDCYALEDTGRRLYDSAFLSRPKGADKSGMGARLSLFEGLGPCRFAGWAKGGEVYRDPWGLGFEYVYERGEPMGQHVRNPYIRILATEEGQTGNVYDSIYFNLIQGPLAEVPGVDCGLTRTFLPGIGEPGAGEIVPSTSGSASKDGGLETFVVFDETHLYTTEPLRQTHATVTRNLRKRKRTAGTWYLETTTMFAAGEHSVAEETFKTADAIEARQRAVSKEGQPKRLRERALFDHRWGECEDIGDEDELRAAIEDAYGEAIGWQDLESLLDEFYDPRKDPIDSARYFTNTRSSASDAWIEEYVWVARRAKDENDEPIRIEIGKNEPVTLGFDGSRSRAEHVTDATALIGCRVSDGHLFEIKVWEQPPGAAGTNWEVPRAQVEAEVKGAFERYRVVGFFADPAKWESSVASWEAKYGPKLLVKSNQKHPIEWWMTGMRGKVVVDATKSLWDAISSGEMTHDGARLLTNHVLHARKRPGRFGVSISKTHPTSPDKIDAAVAAILAFQARLEALANPKISGIRKKRTASRIR